MIPATALEAAARAAETLTPTGDPPLFAAAGVLVLATAALLLLGGRAHRDTAERLRRIDGMVAREECEGGADA